MLNQSQTIEARTLNQVWRHFVSLKSQLGCHAASEVFCYAKDRGIDMSARVEQSEPKVWAPEPTERESRAVADRFREAYNLRHPLRHDPKYNPVAAGMLTVLTRMAEAQRIQNEWEAINTRYYDNLCKTGGKPAAVPLTPLDPARTTISWDKSHKILALHYRTPQSGCSFYAQLETTAKDTRTLAEDALRYRMAKWLAEKERTHGGRY